MSILGWVILGALAGWIASALTGTQEGCLLNIVIGVVGAFLGGYLSSLVGGWQVTGFNIPSLIVAIVGAVVLLLVVGALRGRR
jgi:uncharacterized membrane protein YeaQ/YmgE (transglycosylase-associated protein family)